MKRLSYFSIAQSNLKNRKKSYILLSLGIILSMIFSSLLIFFFSSYVSSMRESEYVNTGKMDCIAVSSESITDSISPYCEVIEQTDLPGLFYVEGADEINGFAAAVYNKTEANLTYPVLLDGRLPENAGEIAVEETALMILNLEDKKVGDRLDLIVKIPDGKGFTDETEEKSFVLTGILHDKKSNIVLDYAIREDTVYVPAAFVSPDEEFRGVPLVLTSFNKKDAKSMEAERLITDMLTSDASVIKFFSIGRDNMRFPQARLSGKENLISFMIISVLLTLITGIGIANAFSSNLKESKRQIGMLRAVGATKRQIIRIFGTETIIISLITVPFSVTVSYFLTKFIIKHMGKDLIFTPDIKVLAAVTFVSLLFIALVSLIPLIFASATSPVQALGNIEYNRKMYRKKIKPEKEFDLSVLYAKRSFTFDSFKRAGVCIILIVTVFVSCAEFTSAMEIYKNRKSYDWDYRITAMNSISAVRHNFNISGGIEQGAKDGFTETDRAEMFSKEAVKSAEGIKWCYANILKDELTAFDETASIGIDSFSVYEAIPAGDLSKDNFIEEVRKNMDADYLNLKNIAEYENYYLPSAVCALTDGELDRLEKYVSDGSINKEKLDSGEEVIVYAKKCAYAGVSEHGGEKIIATEWIPNLLNFKYLKSENNPVKAGDNFEISVLFADSTEVYSNNEKFRDNRVNTRAGAVILYDYYNSLGIEPVNSSSPVKFITSTEGMKHFSPDELYTSFRIYLDNPADEDTDTCIMNAISKLQAKHQHCIVNSLYRDMKKTTEHVKRDILTISSAVIVLFTLCGAIINNSVTAKIRENKKQIGTLRAVGADERELSRCFIRQILSIFLWGGGIGFGSYIILHFAVHLIFRDENYAGILISPTLIAFILLFLICYINLKIKIRKEMKNSIVDNIREL